LTPEQLTNRWESAISRIENWSDDAALDLAESHREFAKFIAESNRLAVEAIGYLLITVKEMDND